MIETYRYPQMLGLFVCGLLLGRSGVLQDDPLRLRRLAIPRWTPAMENIATYKVRLVDDTVEVEL